MCTDGGKHSDEGGTWEDEEHKREKYVLAGRPIIWRQGGLGCGQLHQMYLPGIAQLRKKKTIKERQIE